MSYSKFMKEEYEAIDPEEEAITKVDREIERDGEISPETMKSIEGLIKNLDEEISSKQGNVEESLRNRRSRMLRLKQWPDMYEKIKGNYADESVTFDNYDTIHTKFEDFSSHAMTNKTTFVDGLKSFFGGIKTNNFDIDTFKQSIKDAYRQIYTDIRSDDNFGGPDGASRAKTANIILKEALKGMEKAFSDGESFDQQLFDSMTDLQTLTEAGELNITDFNSKVGEIAPKDVEEVKKLIKEVNDAHDAFWNESMLGSSLKYARKAFAELCKKLLQLVLFLAPYAIPAWLLYSFLRHAFSKCYWINSDPKCNFGDKQKIQTSKHTFGEGTDTFVQDLTFSTDNSKHCKCEDRVRLPQQTQSDESSYIPRHFKDTPSSTDCPGDDNEKGMYCMARKSSPPPKGFKDPSTYPICLEQTEDGVKCNGRYEYYDCDLTEMLNEAADLFKRFINFDPMNLIKMILYGFIAIVLVYVAITVIRYVMAKNKE